MGPMLAVMCSYEWGKPDDSFGLDEALHITERSPLVEDQEVDGEQLAEFGLVILGEAGVLEGLEQRVRAEGEDGVAAATGDVAQGVGEKGFADADGADEGDVVMRLQEAERDELGEEGAIEGDVGGGVPVLELGARVEARPLRPQGGGQAVPARDLVGEDKQEEVLVGQRAGTAGPS